MARRTTGERTLAIPLDFAYRLCDEYVVDEVFTKRVYRNLALDGSSHVLDLGAHVGAFTRYALDQGAARVVAVEMLPATLRVLRANVGHEPNVNVVAAAVTGDRRGWTKAYLGGRGNPMGAFAGTSMRAPRRTDHVFDVDTVSLPDLLQREPFNRLKFDIETAEYDVVTPHVELIRDRGITHVCGEYHVATQVCLDRAHELSNRFAAAGYSRSHQLPRVPTGWGVVVTHVLTEENR